MPRIFNDDTLVLATHNAGKIAELRDALASRVTHVMTAKELNLPEPAETGATFRDNVTIKAVAAARATKKIVLAEDSGLCVNALNGAPGVYTADWAGHPRNFRAAMLRVLAEMNGCDDRSAYFYTVMALAWPDGHMEYAEGRVDGQIAMTMRGRSGFGYDPLFIPQGYASTFGEMDVSIKKTMSHRARALDALLKSYF